MTFQFSQRSPSIPIWVGNSSRQRIGFYKFNWSVLYIPRGISGVTSYFG